jgi:ABC-type nickel/cobalt efflux system permease component RcnA
VRVVSTSASRLTHAVFGLRWVLAPLCWPHTFVPLLTWFVLHAACLRMHSVSLRVGPPCLQAHPASTHTSRGRRFLICSFYTQAHFCEPTVQLVRQADDALPGWQSDRRARIKRDGWLSGRCYCGFPLCPVPCTLRPCPSQFPFSPPPRPCFICPIFCAYTRTYTHMHTHIDTCTHAHTHTCTHAHTHAHTHTPTRTCTCTLVRVLNVCEIAPE